MRSFISKSWPLVIIFSLILNASPLQAYQGQRVVSTSSVAPADHPYLITDASVNYIVINGDGFAPGQITLEKGDSLTWHNATAATQNIHNGIPPAGTANTNTGIFLPIILNNSAVRSSSQSQSVVPVDSPTPHADVQTNPLIATLPPGADYTLTFDQIGAYDYYLDAAPRFTSQVIVTERENTIITRTSPTNGEGDVAVTRETIIEFNHPLSPPSVAAAAIQAQFGGQILTASLHVSPDNSKVTLFYDQPLPASARVRLTIDGDQLVDVDGNAVDADGDGQPGGVALVDFDTLGIAVIPGTSVCGTVYASELGDDGNGGTVDVPLQGTTITVDGMETTLRAVTDGSGAFCLDPAPAGRFFVHIDGRTATANVPAGAYYPFVGKAWEARPGAQTDIGNVYLPLVKPGTLQPVSQSEETMIHLSQSVLDDDPEFADVAIMVPPDSLFADDGTRGGQVGIAPVPPDRLPGTLPENLRFPLVITVQTDGATNFDTPAPVCFPNLPDPDTGETLAPGVKSALMSFNHDAGRWEVVGSVTVSDNGRLACTDPGVGILAPGWHATGPGSPTSGPGGPNGPSGPDGPDGPDESDCPDPDLLPGFWEVGWVVGTCVADIFGAGKAVKAIISTVKGIDKANKQLEKAEAEYRNGQKSKSDLRTAVLVAVANKETIKTYLDLIGTASPINKLEAGLGCLNSVLGLLEPYCKIINESPLVCHSFGKTEACAQLPGIKAIVDSTKKLIGLLDDTLTDATFAALCSATDALIAYLDSPESNQAVYASGEVDPNVIKLLDNVMAEIQPMAAFTDDDLVAVDTLMAEVEAFTASFGDAYLAENGKSPNAYVKVEYETIAQRTQATASGNYQFILPPNTTFTLSVLDPASGKCGQYTAISAANGQQTKLHGPVLSICLGDDLDKDQLSDVAEDIIGTAPANPDSDGDGIPDGAEVQQGTNPLDGLPVQTGIMASADTPGRAVDVCVSGDLAVVADSDTGVSVFKVTNGQSPTIIAQVDTPGNAQRVICSDNDGSGRNLIAVADDASGLVIIDVTDPPAARIIHQLDPGRPAGSDTVTALARHGDVLYAGTVNSQIAVVDMASGQVIQRGFVTGAVRDLAIQGDHLYVLTAKTLDVLTLPTLVRLSSTSSPGSSTSRRLSVGGGYAHVVRGTGYNTFDLGNPAQPTLIGSGETNQSDWKDMALNGSGLGVAAVGPTAIDGPLDDISLYNVTDPSQTDQFLTTIATPGVAGAVVIHDGLAYVADGSAGLQVINYQSYDALGQAPTVSLTTNASGDTATEGQWLDLTADVEDDVQVRAVTFLVDGEVVAVDGTFPFNYRLITPRLTQQATLTVQARAVDTGGNTGESGLQTLTLVADATPPQVLAVSPVDGREAAMDTITSLLALFDDPLDPTSLDDGTLKLFAAGGDGQIGTGDDVEVPGAFTHHAAINALLLRFDAPLPVDQYRAVITTGVRNQSGVALESEYAWIFAVLPKQEVFWVNPNGGDWNDGSNWHTGAPPAAVDDTFIILPGDYDVTTESDLTVGSLSIGAGAGAQIFDLIGRTLTVESGIVMHPNGHLRTSNSVITGTGALRNESILNLHKSDLMLPVDNVGVIKLWNQPTRLRGPINNRATGQFLVNSSIGNNKGRVNAHIDGDIYNAGLIEMQPTSSGFSTLNATLTISGTLENGAASIVRGAFPLAHNNAISILQGAIINEGRVVAEGTIRISGEHLDHRAAGVLAGTGTFDIRSDQFSNAGTIAPGASAGKLTLREPLPMGTTSILEIEIGGLTAGSEHDRLIVSSSATLNGTLNILLIDGFEPQLGDTVTIMTFDSFSGAFATVNGHSIGNGKRWQVQYNPQDVMLEVVTE